tara:strand:+ start:204 stop:533 length:330 start_codon:yes stop_codon:yes gene_type:complete
MANAFKTFTDTAVGTSPATIYTCPASTETTIIGLNVSNILTVSITVDVQLENADGDNVYIVKSAIVPVGSSLVACGGDQKIVMNASDVLKVTASQASAADVAMSVLEIT